MLVGLAAGVRSAASVGSGGCTCARGVCHHGKSCQQYGDSTACFRSATSYQHPSRALNLCKICACALSVRARWCFPCMQAAAALHEKLRSGGFELMERSPRMLPSMFEPQQLNVDCSSKTPMKEGASGRRGGRGRGRGRGRGSGVLQSVHVCVTSGEGVERPRKEVHRPVLGQCSRAGVGVNDDTINKARGGSCGSSAHFWVWWQ